MARVRHRRRAGAHAASVAPPIASGVTVYADEHPADDVQEIALLASVPVTAGHWSQQGEVVVGRPAS